MEAYVKFVKKLEEKSGEGKNGTWKNAMYLCETCESNPVQIAFKVRQNEHDRLAQYDSLKEGDVITLGLSVESREYNGKWYTDAISYYYKKV